jgi:aryl-phospho-beta-D-glucosidase BglC (GH1 family)
MHDTQRTQIWSRHFGFVKQERLGPAVCPGEWGGRARPGSKDDIWHNKIADWFRECDITDSFYWCLNPNSGDTGGRAGGVGDRTYVLVVQGLAAHRQVQLPGP